MILESGRENVIEEVLTFSKPLEREIENMKNSHLLMHLRLTCDFIS